ncbi:MAG TPA: ATP-binding cassette domain-containing protein [Euzebya sp.]|nr:ATP-binding cassette domain-containing protein [Euzebya sp.]
MEPLIEATGLTKHFGDVAALAGLDLVAPSGQVLAILGPNGAGKTTFIRAIATLTRPDAGTLRVAGIDVVRHPQQVRRVIGLAGQYAAVEPVLSGRENLRMVARLFGHGRRQAGLAADAVLDQLGLSEAGDRLVRTYSGGMRRRLDLGASLVGAPRLLLLDEPTTGLDPRSRTELWRAIEALVAQGTDMVLTTQYLEEADRLADRIAIIDRGRLVASGTADELKARVGHDVIDVRVRDAGDLDRAARALGPQASVDVGESRVALSASDGPDQLVAAVQALGGAGIALDDIALRRPTLDDVFLTLTGHTTTTEPLQETVA